MEILFGRNWFVGKLKNNEIIIDFQNVNHPFQQLSKLLQKLMEEYIKKLDMLKIVKNGGMAKGFAFYSLGFFGTLFMTISFITIMMNSLNEENCIQYSYYKVKILKAISEVQKYDFTANQKQMQLIMRNSIQQFNQVETNQKFNQYEYGIKAFETEYVMKGKQLYQSQYLTLKFAFLTNNIQRESCGENCLHLKFQQEEECIEDCNQYLQSVCLVFENNSITTGCYENGEIAQYGQEKQKRISIQLRHNQDPTVLINHQKILMPKIYDPYYLIIIGGLCLLSCVAIMLMIQINLKKESMEIEMQEIVRPQNPRMIPLNY